MLFFFFVKLHAFQLSFFRIPVDFGWLCFLAYVRHVGVSKGNFVLHRRRQGQRLKKCFVQLSTM